MAFVPFDNMARAEMIYTLDGQRMENVLNFWKDGGYDSDKLFDLAESLASWFDTTYKLWVPQAVSLVMVTATDISVEDGMGIDYTSTLPIQGSISYACAPNNVTVAIKYSTMYRGRSFRGRSYVCGVPMNHITGNTISQAYADALVDAFDDLKLLVGDTGTHALQVCSRYLNGVPRVIGVHTAVNNVSVDRTVDSQRRRLPGRGT